MKFSLAALGITLALTGTTVLAQQQTQKSDSSGTSTSSSGPTFTEKVKEAAQNIGEKTKEAAQNLKEMAQQTADKSKADDVEKDRDTKSSGTRDGSSAAVQMQKKADAELKSARAKCASMEDTSQKSICMKQAVATHANAEVRIEKARAADTGNTAAMGAGKSSR